MNNIWKGLAITVSTLVPGVSGGTMAIILGVYDQLLHSIGYFFSDWRKNIMFLGQIALGGIIGLLAFSRLIEFLLLSYPIPMGFFFIGVVLGGTPVLYKRAMGNGGKATDVVYLLVGAGIALMMLGEPPATSNGSTGNLLFLFVAGFITAVALILPGISGSFMLLVMGLYDVTLNAINTFNIPFMLAMGIGVGLGTIMTTKAIERLLYRFPGPIYMLILGFVVGSIPGIYPGLPVGDNLLSILLVFVMGCGLILWISRKER